MAHLWGGLTFDQIAEIAGSSASSAHRLVPCGPDGPERTPGGAMSNEPDPARSRAERDRGRARLARAGPEPHRPRPRDVPGRSGLGAAVAMRAAGLERDRREPRAIAAGRGLLAGPSASPADRRGGGRGPRAGPCPAAGPRCVTPVDQTVAAVPASSRATILSLGQTAHERLAGQVLRYGLDGLPASPTVASPASGPWPASSGQMLQEELRRLLDPGDPS